MVSPPKLCVVGGGAEMFINFRRDFLKAVLAEGWDVYCFAPDFTEVHRAELIQLGVKPIDHHLNPKGLNPIADLIATYQLARALALIKPNAVLNFFVKPVIFGAVAAKLARVPSVVGMIEGLGNSFAAHKGGFTLGARLVRFFQVILYKISLPLNNVVVFLNPDDRGDLLDSYRIKVKRTCILGGIGVNLSDFPYEPPFECPAPTFLFVGRLLREKGIFEFLGAASLVKKKYPDSKFVVLGGMDEGNPFGLSNEDIAPYLEDGSVQFLGHVKDIRSWLRACDVFVLPSYREGVPRSTQEAMAVGRPIITTDVPGCRETVVDGYNGFLVAPFSSSQIADSMIYFIQHPGMIKDMGLASRDMAVKKFDSKVVNRVLISLLFPSSG